VNQLLKVVLLIYVYKLVNAVSRVEVVVVSSTW